MVSCRMLMVPYIVSMSASRSWRAGQLARVTQHFMLHVSVVELTCGMTVARHMNTFQDDPGCQLWSQSVRSDLTRG
jgi:hypothetical protein